MTITPNTICEITGGSDPWLATNKGRMVLAVSCCNCSERHWQCEALQPLNCWSFGLQGEVKAGHECTIRQRWLKPKAPPADDIDVWSEETLPGDKAPVTEDDPCPF